MTEKYHKQVVLFLGNSSQQRTSCDENTEEKLTYKRGTLVVSNRIQTILPQDSQALTIAYCLYILPYT